MLNLNFAVFIICRCYLQGKQHQVDQARQMIEDLIASVNVSNYF